MAKIPSEPPCQGGGRGGRGGLGPPPPPLFFVILRFFLSSCVSFCVFMFRPWRTRTSLRCTCPTMTPKPTSPLTAPTRPGSCSIQNFSALENVLRTGTIAMLCTTETQIEEIWKKEKPDAQADSKGNIEKQHQKNQKCNNAVAMT